MSKILEFKSKDKSGKEKVNGKLEIKNQTGSSSELYFYGDICGSTWDKWQDEDKCPQDVSDFLNQLEGNENIDIYINSGGGDAFAGLAIYNTLKRNTANKTVHVDGLAASAASVIALAGDKLIIPSTAQMMIHKAWTVGVGNANDMRELADDLDKCDESILNVYAENLKDGVDINTVKELVAATTWMTGEDASQYFNVEVEENAPAVAYAESQFFDRYKNLPECLRKNKIEGNKQDNKSNDRVKDEPVVEEPKNNELKKADAEAEALLESCNFLKIESEVM
ncbi:Clp protease ClpP [Clostridium tyrobutyricum]|nr:Clp protease ClpP [Clostridium tyrobutyricum]